jgi:hypothetical protein
MNFFKQLFSVDQSSNNKNNQQKVAQLQSSIDWTEKKIVEIKCSGTYNHDELCQFHCNKPESMYYVRYGFDCGVYITDRLLVTQRFDEIKNYIQTIESEFVEKLMLGHAELVVGLHLGGWNSELDLTNRIHVQRICGGEDFQIVIDWSLVNTPFNINLVCDVEKIDSDGDVATREIILHIPHRLSMPICVHRKVKVGVVSFAK